MRQNSTTVDVEFVFNDDVFAQHRYILHSHLLYQLTWNTTDRHYDIYKPLTRWIRARHRCTTLNIDTQRWIADLRTAHNICTKFCNARERGPLQAKHYTCDTTCNSPICRRRSSSRWYMSWARSVTWWRRLSAVSSAWCTRRPRWRHQDQSSRLARCDSFCRSSLSDAAITV